MKKPNITSLDVAKRAGVSQSVVSRTFSRGPTQSGVSEVTRQKVLAAAEELGYRPNAFARTLITQRSHLVALLFSYLDNPFYAAAMEKRGRADGRIERMTRILMRSTVRVGSGLRHT